MIMKDSLGRIFLILKNGLAFKKLQKGWLNLNLVAVLVLDVVGLEELEACLTGCGVVDRDAVDDDGTTLLIAVDHDDVVIVVEPRSSGNNDNLLKKRFFENLFH